MLRDLIANRSRDVEHAVMLLAPGRPVSDQIRAAGATVYEPTQVVSWAANVATLRKAARAEKADLIHSHSLSPRLVASLSMTGLPHVTTIHTAYLYFDQHDLRSIIKRRAECFVASRLAGPCVCVSEDVARSLPCEAMSSRAVVIVNGIDLARTHTETLVAHRNGDPMLVAVGRLDWEKGFDRLLSAIADVRSVFPRVGIVICGSGAQQQALEAQARELGLSHSVSFVGHVADPTPYFHAADAFISSSLQEGFGLSAAEAMASGRPVIATPTAGLGRTLLDGETAIIAGGFEAADLAAAIVKAFSDKQRLRRIAEAGRRFAEEHYDVKRAVAAYERLYHGLHTEKRHDRRPHSSS